MKLSIIIVNWNTRQLTAQCLNSLSDLNIEHEIILIENGSQDDSVKFIAENFPKIKIIQNTNNLGFARANNQGIKKSRGEYFLFLNSDTIVEENAIETMLDYLEKNPSIGACSPLILNPDKTIQKDPCYLKIPSLLMIWLYYNPLLKQIFKNQLFIKINPEKPFQVNHLSGAALMARGEILKKIGFDESFQLYFEDTDLSLRIRKKGLKLMIIPQAKIIHLGRQSLKKSFDKIGQQRFFLQNYFSLLKLFKKHFPSQYYPAKFFIILNLFSLFFINLIMGLFVSDQKNKAIIKLYLIFNLLFQKEQKIWQ